jgi:hypothetical protein
VTGRRRGGAAVRRCAPRHTRNWHTQSHQLITE